MTSLKTTYQIQTIKAQLSALEEKGFRTIASFQTNGLETQGKVVITKKLKAWHFSDPDLNVIISQICTLHAGLNKEENIFKKFINLMEAKDGKVQSR